MLRDQLPRLHAVLEALALVELAQHDGDQRLLVAGQQVVARRGAQRHLLQRQLLKAGPDLRSFALIRSAQVILP